MTRLTQISVPMTVDEREALRSLAQNKNSDIRQYARQLIQREILKATRRQERNAQAQQSTQK